MAGISLNTHIQDLNLKQPEFSQPIWDYLDVAVSPKRVADGRAALARRLAEAGRGLAHAGGKAAELERARLRLQQALATASVLSGGGSETWRLVARARAIVPRKTPE